MINKQNKDTMLQAQNLTDKQFAALKEYYVDRLVDNMTMKDLVIYVTDDLDQYYSKISDKDFIEDAKNYWDDSFNDVVDEIKEYANCDFTKDRRECDS